MCRSSPAPRRPWRAVLQHGIAAVVAGGLAAGLLWVLLPLQPKPQPAPRPRPTAAGDAAVIAMTGDIMVGHAARKKLKAHGLQYPFEQIAPLLDGADLVTGNLEAPITRHDQKLQPKKEWTYRQKPAVAAALREVGFDVLVLANNHTMDYGATGLLDTLAALNDAGITPLGAGPDEASAREGLVLDLGDVRLGLLAYQDPRPDYDWRGYFAEGDQPGMARLDRVSVAEDIERLRQRADVVIVQCHFGRNYAEADRKQERMARGIVDLGADAVVGHHSHNAQAIEVYRGVPILYSLGNFVFGTRGRFEEGEPGYGLVARLHVGKDGVRRVELDLIGTNNKQVKYQPTVVGEEEARPVLEALAAPHEVPLRFEGATGVVDLTGP